MLHYMTQRAFDRLVTIEAPSPQLRAEDLGAALARFEREGLDSLLSAVRSKRFFWQDDGSPINDDPQHRPRRQDVAGTLMEHHHADDRLDSLAVA